MMSEITRLWETPGTLLVVVDCLTILLLIFCCQNDSFSLFKQYPTKNYKQNHHHYKSLKNHHQILHKTLKNVANLMIVPWQSNHQSSREITQIIEREIAYQTPISNPLKQLENYVPSHYDLSSEIQTLLMIQ